MNYYVLGERELVLGFKLAGVSGSAVTNRQEALDSFLKMTGQSSQVNELTEKDRPKVLILTEDVSDMLSKEVQDWQLKAKSPLIVEIPGLLGHLKGHKTFTDSLREAVGISV
jgi:V/A-type H+-transporting ATPase subunit F